jgi:hypothetical protein
LTIIGYYWVLLAMIVYYWLLAIIDYHWLLLAIGYCWLFGYPRINLLVREDGGGGRRDIWLL